MTSTAPTVTAYLDEFPQERRSVLESVLAHLRAAIQPGFVEQMQYGMITFVVPQNRYPAGYHCDPRLPVSFVALAAQKNGYSLYLPCLYVNAEALQQFQAECETQGYRLDMGKGCLRFKRLDQVPSGPLQRLLTGLTVDQFLADYEASSPKVVAHRQKFERQQAKA